MTLGKGFLWSYDDDKKKPSAGFESFKQTKTCFFFLALICIVQHLAFGRPDWNRSYERDLVAKYEAFN